MSGLFPEQPVLFYPSLAARYGTEEAVLLAIYHDFARHHGAVDAEGQNYFLARRHEWRHLVSFWDEDRLAEITGSLVNQGVIEAEFNANGSIRVTLYSQPLSGAVAGQENSAADTEPAGTVARTDQSALDSGQSAVSEPPSSGGQLRQAVKEARAAISEKRARSSTAGVSQPAAGPISGRGSESQPRKKLPEPSGAWQALQQSRRAAAEPAVGSSMLQRGPAPSFGGSVGWSRPKDELEVLFDQQEKRNQTLHEMHADWQPDNTTQHLLKKQNIPPEFAETLIDEFVTYWSMRDRKEASWDHLFIRLVKKQWVKEQTRQGRLARSGDQDSSEVKGERYQPNHRAEKRERITREVMDINNIDW